MPAFGPLELLLIVALMALFTALVVGAFFLLRAMLRRPDQTRRINELEREVAELKGRQQ